MRRLLAPLMVPFALTLGCVRSDGFAPMPAVPQVAIGAESITTLSDEFGDSKTITHWRHAFADEGWHANQLERFDISRTQPGWMMMEPYASTWYRDFRGVLTYKPVEGDFAITTRVRVSGRRSAGPPKAQFSLAGIMVRVPRSDTAFTWHPGQENYVFLSLGAADTPGSYQLEVKSTTNSDSQLRIVPAASGEALIQVVRIGGNLLLLTNTDGQWRVHQRYWRPDFPARLQAGLTCYTDWPTANQLSPQQHNDTVIRSGNPDLLAYFDYVRYRRPRLPSHLTGKSLADVPDAQLLRFLGDTLSR